MITKRWQIFWPPVSDLKDIRITVWLGCFAAFFYAIQWGFIVLLGLIAGIVTVNLETIRKTLEPLIHLAIAASIGLGILKKYKAAPVAGLLLSIYGFIGNWVTKGFINKAALIMVLDAWMFIQATRGIFAYHRIKRDTEIEKTANV